MQITERYISELLYTHDCVIVPNLGGFLASNQPSSVSPVSHSIFPPFRKIAFNIYLRQNDGLLANHLMSFENISYEEALKEIDRFVSSCFDSLDRGQKVVLHNIGSLYYDTEKNIQFEANRNVNYLIDSFGLQPVHFSPVHKMADTQKVNLVPNRPSVPQPKPNRINAKRARNILGVVGITAAIAWFSFNLYLVTPKKYQSTSVTSFDSQSFVPKKDTVSTAHTTAPVPAKVETVYVAAVNPDEKTVTPSNDQPKVEIPANNPVNTSSALSHHVISGVFKIRENAESQVAILKSRGFADATIIVANGRNYVTFGSFSSHREAVAMADSLRGDSAWIWKN